jgi:selenide,water dikinase
MRGECDGAWLEKLTVRMLLSNGPAAAVFDALGVRACTDVTGFGLAGHLLEMCDASHVSARLTATKVPVYEGFAEVVEKGIVSTLQRGNSKAVGRVRGAGVPPAWLFDPQTSGGLIAGVKPNRVNEALEKLHAAGYTDAAEVGEAIPLGGGLPAISLE